MGRRRNSAPHKVAVKLSETPPFFFLGVLCVWELSRSNRSQTGEPDSSPPVELFLLFLDY